MSILMTLAMTMLTDNIMDYYFVAQGKTSIPGVDDGEELTLTDVRHQSEVSFLLLHLCLDPSMIYSKNSIRLKMIRSNGLSFTNHPHTDTKSKQNRRLTLNLLQATVPFHILKLNLDYLRAPQNKYLILRQALLSDPPPPQTCF